jgi:hypothetical protein
MNLSSKRLSVFLTPLVFLISCSDRDITVTEPIESETADIREIGQKTTAYLMQTLQAELRQAIETEGIAAAIDVCNLNAMMLTKSAVVNSDRVIDIKRTSYKYRNPKNAPDEVDHLALQYFNTAVAGGEKISDDYTLKIEDKSGVTFRYYKPLFTKPLCLTCHGSAAMVSREIRYQIQRLYPEDYASGYLDNQFRGVVRVSIK